MLPEPRARAAIAALGERLRLSHRVNGVLVAPDNLQLSICPRGRADHLRQPLESTLLEAASSVRATAFEVVLDSAMRLSAREGQYPLVFCSDGRTSAPLVQLRKAIATEQARRGLQVGGVSSFLPHVVCLQGPSVEEINESIAPISWLVSEFVLIRSFFGHSREVIGRWPLIDMVAQPLDNLLDELANMPELPDPGDLSI